MKFHELFSKLEEGYLLTLSDWPEDTYLTLSEGKSSHFVYAGLGKEGRCLHKRTLTPSYIIKMSPTNTIVGWTPDSYELFSNNWKLYEVTNDPT